MHDNLVWYLELPGWYGSAAFLVAYALLTLKIIKQGWIFHGLNLTGSITFGFTGFMHGHWQSVILEICWGSIALWGMAQLVVPLLEVNLPDTLDDVDSADIDIER